ncbi:hypothetical protein [Tomitella biformata]|uniref:hypothetical protein n=1 Tax=Tomitella biformata TaxID=630403 RepID=UPI000464D8C6|nr:hypothetical protein [Tomitella biformata]
MTQPPFGNYPPPPAGGFGDYPAAGPTLNVGDALGFGWSRFKDNALPWIGIVLLTAVVSGVLSLLGGGSFSTTSFSDGTTEINTSFGARYVLFMLLTLIVGWIFQAAMVRGALDEVDGRKPGFGAFFQLPNIGMILLTGLIVGVLTTIGFALLFIPGVIVLFLSYFAMQFVVDKKLPAIDAVKSSWSVISKNVGPLLLLALAVIGINIIGILVCFVGLLVTLPITGIAVSYAYRALSGAPAHTK